MALPTPPSPLTAFAKTVFGSPGLNPLWPWLNFYDFLHQMGTSGQTWRRFQARCVDVTDPRSADFAFISWDVVNYTNGIVDESWTESDYNTVVGQLSLILQDWATFMPADKKFDQIAAYVMAFNPNFLPPGQQPPGEKPRNPFLDSGPPDFIAPQGHIGSAAGSQQASQVALSVTEMVPLRRHWGRFFLPFPSGSIITSDHMVTSTVCDQVATVVHGVYDQLAAAEFYPVIPQSQHQKETAQALLQVTGVQVDNNPDVIRRRRRRNTTYRKTIAA